jgi:nucleoside 2-deoxyribosyltransferase/SAM-dependent methyltransferase
MANIHHSTDEGARVYWANALFSEADRSFNARCAERLREAGYTVFLPQEATINKETSPMALEIFRSDSSEILNSDLLVACLDQETIDCGVACEIGLAYAFDIPMVGLYTDIRQFRQGSNRIYKNPYILGAIERNGRIVASVDGVLRALPDLLLKTTWNTKGFSETTGRHYEEVTPNAYASFVQDLETWYFPRWNATSVVERWIHTFGAKRVFEIGCGLGELANTLRTRFPSVVYIGFDSSRAMIDAARARSQNPNSYYTCSKDEALIELHENPADLALALFTVHDHPSKSETLAFLTKCVRQDGVIGIVDLSVEDLPHLTRIVRRRLASPAISADPRMGAPWLRATSVKLGLDIIEYSLALIQIRFPSAQALIRYLRTFGIYHGLDLPLGLANLDRSMTKKLVEDWLPSLEYPFIDDRVFQICTLKKTSSRENSSLSKE